ncbi:MAG TPA: adenylate/guanylate cyclase domain-containing protein [Kiritimatiellia bacterium]|nr:adenylate/guanylate cyclase domain-containing protein [Kiritimatiellia bacterium]
MTKAATPPPLRRKAGHALLVGVAAGLVALSASHLRAIEGIENVTWAWRVRMMAKPSPSTEEIKLVLIDQFSLDWVARELEETWIWPREFYAYILWFLEQGGAKAVAFDMLYTEASRRGVYDDQEFGEAVARLGNVILPAFLGEQTGQALVWPEWLEKPRFSWAGDRDRIPVEPAAAFPVRVLAESSAWIGGVREEPDRDGVFRRVAPFRSFDGQLIPFLGLAAGLPKPEEDARIEVAGGHRRMRVGDVEIPLTRRNLVLPRFRGKSGTHEAISAAAILRSAQTLLEGGENPAVSPELFRDRYVFIGVSAPGLKDLRSTPVDGDYNGVEIHATFLDNFLEGDFLREPTRAAKAAGVLGAALLAALWVMAGGTARSSIAASVVMLAAPFVMGVVGYAWGWWWEISSQLLGAGLALAGGVIYNYATEGKQKRFIKNAFQYYLSAEVIERMLADPSQLSLGGEKRELSIFFSDLQGFSTISEKLDPVALTALLNDYLTDMSDIVMEEGGTVDKYEGDAIIAFWNAPVHQADHAERACRAAIRCQRKLAERREEFAARTGAKLFMRIGIHTGDVVVGNMGSRDRFNYTVLGDAANLAARLEGANKAFGSYLMVSEATWSQNPAGKCGRELGMIRVVGRATPVKVFEVLGLTGETPPGWLATWNEAMAALRAGEHAKARELMATLENDAVAKTYVAKLDRSAGAGEVWDGIWNLTEK